MQDTCWDTLEAERGGGGGGSIVQRRTAAWLREAAPVVSNTHRSIVVKQPGSPPPNACQDVRKRVAISSSDKHGFTTASDEQLHAERLTDELSIINATNEKALMRDFGSRITCRPLARRSRVIEHASIALLRHKELLYKGYLPWIRERGRWSRKTRRW